jgi:hypothetical protein
MQPRLGEQQFPIGSRAAVQRQWTCHVTDGCMLGHRIAIDLNLHHGGWSVLLEMFFSLFRQLNAGQQSVVEGNRHQLLILTFNLGQQRGGAAFEDALDTSLR